MVALVVVVALLLGLAGPLLLALLLPVRLAVEGAFGVRASLADGAVVTWAVQFGAAPFLVADQGLDAIEAFRESSRIARRAQTPPGSGTTRRGKSGANRLRAPGALVRGRTVSRRGSSTRRGAAARRPPRRASRGGAPA